MLKKMTSIIIIIAIMLNTNSFADQIAQSIVKKASIYNSKGQAVTLHSLTEGQYVTLKSTDVKYINKIPMYQTHQNLYIPKNQLKFIYMTPYKTAGYYKLNKDVKLRTQPYSGMDNLTKITLKANDVISIHDTLYTERGTQWGITKVKNKNYYLYMGNVDKVNYTPAPKKNTPSYTPILATGEAIYELGGEVWDMFVGTIELVGELYDVAKYNVTHRNIIQDNIDLFNLIIKETSNQDWSQYGNLLVETYTPVAKALKGVGSAVANELSSELELGINSGDPNKIYTSLFKLITKTVFLVNEGTMVLDDGITLLKTAKNSLEADDVMRVRATMTGSKADDFDNVIDKVDDIIDDFESNRTTTYLEDADNYDDYDNFDFDDPDFIYYDYENNYDMLIERSGPFNSSIYVKDSGTNYTEVMNTINSGIRLDRSHLPESARKVLNQLESLEFDLMGHSRGNLDERSAQRLILEKLTGTNVMDEVRVLPITYTDARKVRIIDVLDYDNGISIEVKTGFLSKSYVEQMYKDDLLKNLGGYIKSSSNGLVKDSYIKTNHTIWAIFRGIDGVIGYDREALELLRNLGIEVIFYF